MKEVKVAGVGSLGTLEVHDNETLESIDISDLLVPPVGAASGGGGLEFISCLNPGLRSMATPPGDSVNDWDVWGNPNLQSVSASPETINRFKDKFDQHEKDGIQIEEDDREPDYSAFDGVGKELVEELIKDKATDKLLEELGEKALYDTLETKAEKSALLKTLAKYGGKLVPRLIPGVQLAMFGYDIYTIYKGIRTIYEMETSSTTDLLLDSAANFLVRHGPALESGDFNWEQALSGQNFAMPLHLGEWAKRGDSSATGGVSNWKAVFRGSFDYAKSSDRSDGFEIDGRSFSYVLGLDLQPRPSLMTGVNLVLNNSTSDYEDIETTAKGSYDLDLITVHPYIQWRATDALGLYASFGYGRGSTRLEVDDINYAQLKSVEGSSRKAEGDFTNITAGINYKLWQSPTTALGLRLDGSTTSLLDVDVQQGRLSTELSHNFALDGGLLNTALDLGLQMSSEDESTVELSSRFNWFPLESCFTWFGSARVLLFAGDQQEWGVGGGLHYETGSSNEGLSLALEPSIGRTGTRLTDDFWLAVDGADLTLSNAPYTAQLRAEMGYGFRTGKAVLTPYTEVFLSHKVNSYGAGLRYNLDNGLDLDLKGIHKNRTSGNNDNRILFQLRTDL